MSGSTNPILGTSFGLTEAGFIRLRLEDIRTQILQDLQRRTGYQFDATPDTITGQFIDTFAEREAILWEQLEQLYFSMYPETAEGVSLDLAVSFAGITRLQARRTEVIGVMEAPEGTLVPVGTLALVDNEDQNRMMLFTNVTVSRNNFALLVLRVNDGATTALITINTIDYSVSAANPSAVATALAASINAGATAQATASGQVVVIKTVEDAAAFLSRWEGVTIQNVGSPGSFQGVDFNGYEVPVGALSRFVSVPAGVTRITNNTPGNPGRQRETDRELRLRYRDGTYRLGAATDPALRANLEELPGVSLVRIFSNRTNSTDADGRPPHSVEAVVTGGEDITVARTLYNLVASGIATHGNTTQVITDRYGVLRTVKFTRPQPLPIWITIAVTRAPEEELPTDFADLIRTAIVSLNDELLPGNDVYLDRIKSRYAGVAGIARSTITATTGTSSAPSGAYGTADIAVGPRSKPLFDANWITVTGP